MKELREAAAVVGLIFATNTIWTGINGRRPVRGYRFFTFTQGAYSPDWHQGGEIHTAKGRKAAADYIKGYAQGYHAGHRAGIEYSKGITI